MAIRLIIVFALTNSFAVGAFSAYVRGGAAGFALGVILSVFALAGFVVTGRVVVLARPTRRQLEETRRLTRQFKESLR